jgi:hypothetical protein
VTLPSSRAASARGDRLGAVDARLHLSSRMLAVGGGRDKEEEERNSSAFSLLQRAKEKSRLTNIKLERRKWEREWVRARSSCLLGADRRARPRRVFILSEHRGRCRLAVSTSQFSFRIPSSRVNAGPIAILFGTSSQLTARQLATRRPLSFSRTRRTYRCAGPWLRP